MKIVVVLTITLSVCVANVIVPAREEVGVKKYPRFMDMYDDMGNLHRVDLEEQLDEAALHNVTKSAAFNQYWLYTRSNPTVPQYLYLDQTASIVNSNFNPNRPVVVSVHGWINSGHTEPNPALIPGINGGTVYTSGGGLY